jgi:ketosteroid isomerase-like protein
MGKDNVDVVLQACAAWERLDPLEIAAFYAPGAELLSQRAEMSGRTYHGREGLREWIADFSAAFDRPRMEFQEVVDAGQRVLVTERLWTHGRSSGVQISIKLANAFMVQNGLITRHVAHEDRVKPSNPWVSGNRTPVDAGSSAGAREPQLRSV